MNLQIINGCAGTNPGLPTAELTLVDAISYCIYIFLLCVASYLYIYTICLLKFGL